MQLKTHLGEWKSAGSLAIVCLIADGGNDCLPPPYFSQMDFKWLQTTQQLGGLGKGLSGSNLGKIERFNLYDYAFIIKSQVRALL